ncbi:Fe(2+)/2-oxoglutarate-dependent oxygenase fmaF [Aspergillus stella-maris]|uniref:Fe(2+)/2-oxoglutarate-dependent oxygenase fmaF n=1 Tax=Aspergillus stella-maris TaxID=1810926 RepID=UPI003CCD6342
MAISMHPLSAAQLSEAKTSLDSTGYAIIPDILSPSKTEHVYQHLWTAATTHQSRGGHLHLPALDPNASNIRIFYLMSLEPLFRDLIQHPAALQLAKAVLGDQMLVSNFTANIARPGSKSMALHSDQSLVVPEPWEEPWGINIIWCLDDVYFENGATLFIPGSHKWTRRADVPDPDSANAMLQPFTAKAGSIVAMDARVWHTSGANVTSDKDRALLFGFYTRPFLRQQVNWTAVFGDDVRGAFSEEFRGLLGLNITANTGKASEVGGGYVEGDVKRVLAH